MRDTATSDWVREIAEREIAKLEGRVTVPPLKGNR
jgi:hypothetical protein